jgi:hypothetical protein
LPAAKRIGAEHRARLRNREAQELVEMPHASNRGEVAKASDWLGASANIDCSSQYEIISDIVS